MAERVYKIDETDELPPQGYYWFAGEAFSRSYGEWDEPSGPGVVYVGHDYDDRWVEFPGNDTTAPEGAIRGIFIGPLDMPAEFA